MVKYTHSENASLTQLLSATAKVAGLLEADERLQYEKGGRGTATVIRAQKLDEQGNWRNQLRPSWVPEFGYKDGPSTVGTVLFAVLNAVEPFETEPKEDVTWGELEFRPEGWFYIERLKASTSEYWPFRVIVNGPSVEAGYTVYDDTTDALMGIIVPSSNRPAFLASVNGYEQDQVFTNLKGAVVHIVTEFNG